MPLDDLAQAAISIGRQQSREVLAFRVSARAERVHALGVLNEKLYKGTDPTMARVRSETAGLLVAEGDSWFDYPFHDVVERLEDKYAYDVECVAHRGDRIEEMAYDCGQLEEFARAIEKILRQGRTLTAILLSGGGNDIAGSEFGMLVNHARSAIAGLNHQILTAVVTERVRLAYITILQAVKDLCVDIIGHPVPVLIHGYDHPVPDGRGYVGGWGPIPGPWLEPGFREKGFDEDMLSLRTEMTRVMIDEFNEMLKGVAGMADFKHVHYIDLRGTLPHTDYTKWWANELHPTQKGFEAVTARFVEVLRALP